MMKADRVIEILAPLAIRDQSRGTGRPLARFVHILIEAIRSASLPTERNSATASVISRDTPISIFFKSILA